MSGLGQPCAMKAGVGYFFDVVVETKVTEHATFRTLTFATAAVAHPDQCFYTPMLDPIDGALSTTPVEYHDGLRNDFVWLEEDAAGGFTPGQYYVLQNLIFVKIVPVGLPADTWGHRSTVDNWKFNWTSRSGRSMKITLAEWHTHTSFPRDAIPGDRIRACMVWKTSKAKDYHGAQNFYIQRISNLILIEKTETTVSHPHIPRTRASVASYDTEDDIEEWMCRDVY
jgi:hypothetical protein